MVDPANLQSHLYRSSDKAFFAVVLFKLGPPEEARGFLEKLLPRVTSGALPEATGTPLLNLSFSWRAIAALVRGSSDLDPEQGRRQFEPFFTDPKQSPGSASVADQLGFTGPSAPEHWWSDFRSEDIDLAVHLGCDDETERRYVLAALRSDAASSGLTELMLPTFADGAASGFRPAGGRLHFGYRDGITTPDVDWSDGGKPGSVDLREFVVGYPNDDYPTAPFPSGAWQDFARDGSFACMTWIHQDVASFDRFLTEQADRDESSGSDPEDQEWLAARLMGRWRDGSPLSRHPASRPAVPDVGDDGFGFSDDPSGERCPLHAHIRVVNCRDQPLSFGNASRFPNGPPRLIRRGFSYGEPLATSEDDGKDRGLFGIFLCARVNEQFYTVLRWMQRTEFSDVFDDTQPGRAGQDLLTGSRRPGDGMEAPAAAVNVGNLDRPLHVSLQPFIRYKGAAVLFHPSIAALSRMSHPR